MRQIPKKNYLILTIIFLLSFFIAVYFQKWYQTYEQDRLTKPIMNKYLMEIKENEIDNYLVENPNTIIYVGKLENELIRNFEKEFINTITKNQLQNQILYLDITNINDNQIKNKYQLDNKKITQVPNIMFFKNGKLENIYVIDVKDYNTNKIASYILASDIIGE